MAMLQCEVCGGKLVGKPGGIFECEYCGMQYDTSWAKAKIQEIKGTVQVEGTVEVKGTVTVDNKANKENFLRRIAVCAEDKDYEKLHKLVDELLNTDSECWGAYLWDYVGKARFSSIDDIFNQRLPDLINFKNSKYWKNALRCMPAEIKEATEGRLSEKIEYWTHENAELKKKFDRIQPVRNLLYTVNKSIVGLHSDGTVSVSYPEEDKWLAPVSKWKGVKKICVRDDSWGFVLGLCWDGRVLIASARQNNVIDEIQRWIEYNDNEADEFSKIVDIVIDGLNVACLWDDGEVTSTADGLVGKSSYFFGYACDWENVKEISYVKIGVSRYVENKLGLTGDDNVVYMILGLTHDNRILCSASCSGLIDDSQIALNLDIEKIENLRNVRTISKRLMPKFILRDGTLISDYREVADKWLDFNLTDKGVITCDYGAPSDMFSERDLLLGDCSGASIRADGTVVRAFSKMNNEFKKPEEVEEWNDIVALKDYGYFSLIGLKEDGTVLLSLKKYDDKGISVDGWKLFGSLDTFEEERKAAENKYSDVAKNKWLANQKKREEEKKVQELELNRIQQERRNSGLCQHCGGTFKGLFTKKCTNCGKEKDY